VVKQYHPLKKQKLDEKVNRRNSEARRNGYWKKLIKCRVSQDDGKTTKLQKGWAQILVWNK
jgi:hypothetical protein